MVKTNNLVSQIQTAFNHNFRLALEYHLSQAFHNCKQLEYKYFWCDGISEPDLSQPIDNNIPEIATKAWFEKDGQEKYKMIVKLGEHSLENCRKGLSLENCLPDATNLDWVVLDIENMEIIIALK